MITWTNLKKKSCPKRLKKLEAEIEEDGWPRDIDDVLDSHEVSHKFYGEGFVSNSSSTSFIIEFDKDKEISIKMPLTKLLKLFGGGYGSYYEEDKNFTESSIKDKESPRCWKVKDLGDNKIEVKGEFYKSGMGSSQIESIIQEEYGCLDALFNENDITIKDR